MNVVSSLDSVALPTLARFKLAIYNLTLFQLTLIVTERTWISMTSSPVGSPEPAVGLSRDLLMVSFAFYPCASVGAHRAGKLSKYLPEYGWRPRILTVKEKHYELRDSALSAEISPEAQVKRTGYLGIEILKPLLPTAKSETQSGQRTGGPHRFEDRIRPAPESWFDLPRGIGWLPFGLARGIALAKKCDAIWATSPLPGGLCLGALLSRHMGKPFVADLQDPWHLQDVSPYPTGLHRLLNQSWERFVLDTARLILVTTDETKEMYESQYRRHAGKIAVMPIGYDSADFGEPAGSAPPADTGTLHVGYFGSLYQGRESCMLQLMSAVKTMLEERPGTRVSLYVRGRKPERAIWLADKAGVRAFADIEGPISHKQTIEMMKRMDVLVLLGSPKHTHALPSKVFEYIGARKPVLAVTPPSVTTRFLEENQIGISADPGKIVNIRTALQRITKNYLFYLAQIDLVAPKFTNRVLAREFAGMLTAIVEKSS